jgi:glucan phosphoethanolaminetransferase (alkaline phosphatase superfamily)
MITIWIWIFIAYGMTSILVWGSIFENQRVWIKKHSKFFGDLISCTLCTATWVGFFMSIVIGHLSKTIATDNLPTLVWIFFDGMFTAGAVWAINTIVEFFEESRIK